MKILTTHKSSDFDGVASMVAGMALYPDAIPVLPKSINPNVRAFLSIHKDIFEMYSPDEIDLAEVKQLIVVDTNQWRRLDKMNALADRKDLDIMLWDHHPIQGDIQANWKCQRVIGANITLMVEALRKSEITLSPIETTLFLAGIYEDTGNLSFNSTTASDAYAAAYLLEHGADLKIINQFLRPVYGEQHKDILFKMLKIATRTHIKGYSISFCQLDIKGHVNSLAIVVHMYREILNVDAAFGIFIDSDKDKIMVIARSSSEDLNIGQIMQALGGGGHVGAGSAVLKSVKSDVIIQMISELIEGNQHSTITLGDIMSYPVFSVPPQTLMKEVAMYLREKGCTGVPVVDDDRLLGMISRRDFKKIRKQAQLMMPVKAFMNTSVRTITPDKSPMQAARYMVKHDIGRLPVVKNDRMIGIVTRSDAMNYFYDTLPE